MFTKNGFILSFALLMANITFVGSTLSMDRDLIEVENEEMALKMIDSYVTKLKSEYKNNSWLIAAPGKEANLNVAAFKKITKLQDEYKIPDIAQSENSKAAKLGTSAMQLTDENAQSIKPWAILRILKANFDVSKKTNSDILSKDTISSLKDVLKTELAGFLASDRFKNNKLADSFAETIKHYNLQ